MKKNFLSFFLIILVGFFATNSTAQDSSNKSIIPPQNAIEKIYTPEVAAQLRANTLKAIDPDNQNRTWLNTKDIIENLNIQKDTEIVDIGAGLGYFTFPFAKALAGTGKVYATEMTEERVTLIKEKAEELNLENVESVLISSKGLDPFYKNNYFDLVFLCDTFYLIKNRIEYFKELLPSLNKNGKLCIIDPKYNVNFTYFINPEINGDFMILFDELKKMGENFPITKRLSEETKNFILNWVDDGKNAIPIEIRKNFIEDLNNMLLDRKLVFDVIDFYIPNKFEFGNNYTWGPIYALFPEKSDFMNWLAVSLMQNNAFEKESLTEDEKVQLFRLNFLLIQSILKLPEDRMVQEAPTSKTNFLIGKKGIVNILSSAGYKLSEEYDLPLNVMLIFKAAENN